MGLDSPLFLDTRNPQITDELWSFMSDELEKRFKHVSLTDRNCQVEIRLHNISKKIYFEKEVVIFSFFFSILKLTTIRKCLLPTNLSMIDLNMKK